MRTQRLILPALLALTFGLGSTDAAILYVSTTGNDANAGTSPATALRNIQTAYNRAAANDEIRVLPGPPSYTECVNAFVDYGDPDKPVRIVAQAWLDSQNRTATVIDGSGICGAGATAALATVILGDGVSFEGFTVRGNTAGIRAFGSVAITNNVIENNESIYNGGGLYCYTGTCFFGDSSIVISNNLIQNNQALGTTSGVYTYQGYGGGLFVFAYAYNGGGIGCYTTGEAQVTITNNTIQNNSGKGWGGGLFAYTKADPGRTATVAISNNTINGNSVATLDGYYGYGGGMYLSTYGTGDETVQASNNTLAGNTATADGAGIAAWLRARNQADHTLELTSNTVTGNDADRRGGGLDLFVEADTLVSPSRYAFAARGNTVTGNTALDTGGGAQITVASRRSAGLPVEQVEISGSTFSGNTSLDFGLGGGVSLFVGADSDPDLNGNTLPTEAFVDFRNNRITGNTADPPTGTSLDGLGTGGGVFALLQAQGDAVAEIDFTLNTVADNTIDDTLGIGGIYLEAWTGFDAGAPATEGLASFVMNSSIVADNDGQGVGGSNPAQDGIFPPVGSTANFTTVVRYSDVFGHPGGNYDTIWFNDRTGQNGNISANPQLAATTYFPSTCSPTIDAGDPALPFSTEPFPGLAVNMGHTGNTASATRGLADPTADGRVEGVDVLRLSLAFATTSGQPRYDVAADFDRDNMVDGDDLSLLTADFGDVCP